MPGDNWLTSTVILGILPEKVTKASLPFKPLLLVCTLNSKAGLPFACLYCLLNLSNITVVSEASTLGSKYFSLPSEICICVFSSLASCISLLILSISTFFSLDNLSSFT